MKNFKLLTSVFFIISVFLFVSLGTAQAITWYGFASLHFDGQLKGGNYDKFDGLFTVYLADVVVTVACKNVNSDNGWHPGVGNFGDYTYYFPATVSPEGKGKVDVEGDISLHQFDDVDDPNFINICNSSTNPPNKVPIYNSAFISHISVDWSLAKCLNEDCSETKPDKNGVQECDFPGWTDPETGITYYVDPETGLPISFALGELIQFECSIDELFH